MNKIQYIIVEWHFFDHPKQTQKKYAEKFLTRKKKLNKHSSLFFSNKIKTKKKMSEIEVVDQIKCEQGIFVKCDTAMRELIKYIDATRALGCSFIIAELDENHLFLDARKVPDLEKVLEQRREDLCPDLNERDNN